MVERVFSDHRQFKFIADDHFRWSPATDTIYFSSDELAGSRAGLWSLLHELGHALLGHKDFTSDIELIKLERAAWDKAALVAQNYGLAIDTDHIEDCIDTYRLWLSQRSTCPVCSQVSLQNESLDYTCFNCGASWEVPRSQACKVVRTAIKKPASLS